MVVETEDPDLYYYQLAEDVFIAIDPILTIVGVLANTLAFLVVQRKRINTSPVAVFMSALAVTDSLVLILDFLNNWLKMKPKIYLLGDPAFCLLHRFLFNVCYTYATWLVASLSVERFLVVWFPFKAKSLCTIKGAIRAVIIQPVVISVLYLYNFWGYTINENGKCDVHPQLAFFMNHISPWLTAFFYSYIPILVISVSNICIIIKLASAHVKRRAMVQEDSTSRDTKITLMVVVVCLVFLLLTVPVTAWYLIIFAAGQFIDQGPKTTFIEVIILIFALSNHVVNFFLYVLASESFRKEFIAMITCGKTVLVRKGFKYEADKSGYKSKDTKDTGLGSSEQDTFQAGQHI